jgi:Zn-dependent peptidase ImmA (M78 family)
MIQPHRKIQISNLAEFIANQFSLENKTKLLEIAREEIIPVHFDDYENAFDGILLFDPSTTFFHIHINTNRGNWTESKRGHFTLAHEFGHFFIDEHRLGLKYGNLSPHPSFHSLNNQPLIEEEADYFASCLLLPKNIFEKLVLPRKFSFETLRYISDSCQVSILCSLIRFAEIGNHEIFAIISKNNIAKWFVPSHDFPHWKSRFKIGDTLPPTTVAGEYFTMADKKITGVEDLSADDWFLVPENDKRAKRKMHEQCFYSDSYDYVISLLWFD